MVLTSVPVVAMGVMAVMEETAAEKKRKKCRFRTDCDCLLGKDYLHVLTILMMTRSSFVNKPV